MLLIMAGLPGTGKSTLARALAEHTGAVVLDKDHIRAALFPTEAIEYSREQDDFVLRVMLKVAGWMLRKQPQRIVILDGRPFAKKYQLDLVINFAEWLKTPWRIVECTCSDEIAHQRMQDADHPASDRSFELYERVKSEWEEITQPKLLVQTELPLNDNVERILTYVRTP